MSDLHEHEYLGDAVYASNDGWQIWLHLNDHNSPAIVALEPKVLEALIRYAETKLGYEYKS
jgi:hypothetical protein